MKDFIQMKTYLGAQNEVVISQIPNPKDETKLPVPLIDDGTLAEHDSLCPHSWTG